MPPEARLPAPSTIATPFRHTSARTTSQTRTDPIVPTTKPTRHCSLPSSSPVLSIYDLERRFQNRPSLAYGRHSSHIQSNTTNNAQLNFYTPWQTLSDPLPQETSSNSITTTGNKVRDALTASHTCSRGRPTTSRVISLSGKRVSLASYIPRRRYRSKVCTVPTRPSL